MVTYLIVLAAALLSIFTGYYCLYRSLSYGITCRHEPDVDVVMGYFTGSSGRENLNFVHSHDEGLQSLYDRTTQGLLPAPGGVRYYKIPHDARVCNVTVCRKSVLVTFRRPSRLNRKAFTGHIQLQEELPRHTRYVRQAPPPPPA